MISDSDKPLAGRIALYREGLAECKEPAGKFVNDQAATFTMVHCEPDKESAYATAADSFVWYVRHGSWLIASVAELLEGKDLGSYEYTAAPLEHHRAGPVGERRDDRRRVGVGQ